MYTQHCSSGAGSDEYITRAIDGHCLKGNEEDKFYESIWQMVFVFVNQNKTKEQQKKARQYKTLKNQNFSCTRKEQ